MILDTWVISKSKVVPSVGCDSSSPAVLWTLDMASFLSWRDWNWLASSCEPRAFSFFFFQELPQWPQSLFHSSLSLCFFSSPKECPMCYPPPVPHEAGGSGLGSLGKGPLFYKVPRISTHILTSRRGGCVHFMIKHQRLFLQIRTFMGTERIGREGLINISV